MKTLIIAISSLVLLAACGSDPAPDAAPAATPAAAHVDASPPADGEAWTCSMHPDVRMHEAGRCPKCNMDLVHEGSMTGDHAGHDHGSKGH